MNYYTEGGIRFCVKCRCSLKGELWHGPCCSCDENATADIVRVAELSLPKKGYESVYIVFRHEKTNYIYTCRPGDERKLIERKLAQTRQILRVEWKNGFPYPVTNGGTHAEWDIVEISTQTFPSARAAKKAARAKWGY